MQSDVKEVHKIVGEPVVNVRKLRQRPMRPASRNAQVKSLNIKQGSKAATADEVIDDA